MRSVQRPAIVSLTSLAVVAVFVMTPVAPSAQRIASEFGAAGAPYADPAYCSALPALVKNFQNTILPKQAQDLAEQRSRLSEAEAGRAEAAEEFNQAMRDGIKTLATDQLSTAKALRARVNAMKASNMSKEARRNWLEKIKTIEEAGEQIKQGMGRADFVQTMQKNQTDLVSFMKFVEDSGASDALLKGLADTLAPGVGGLVVSGIKVGLDVVYAGLKGRFTAQEAAQWRDNVAKLDQAHSELKDKVENYKQDLTGGVCGPKVAQQVQNSPQPIAPAEVARTAPPAPPTPTPIEIPRVPSGGGMGKILVGTVAVAGAAIGGAYLLKQAEELSSIGDFSGPSPITQPLTAVGFCARLPSIGFGNFFYCSTTQANLQSPGIPSPGFCQTANTSLGNTGYLATTTNGGTFTVDSLAGAQNSCNLVNSPTLRQCTTILTCVR